MKKTLLASAALIIALSGAASASALIDLGTTKLTAGTALMQLAKKGSDDGGSHDSGDDHGGSGGNSGSGSGNSGSGSSNSGHGSSNSGSSHDDDDDDNSSGSGRSKPRVPGGSGCDSAGDIAEHAECSAGI
ncbi:MAG: hypothetical protein JNM45_09655 [Rhizobiales bacterium]|nr:hypothetical protein [Hyphomicrobiales bacterium]